MRTAAVVLICALATSTACTRAASTSSEPRAGEAGAADDGARDGPTGDDIDANDEGGEALGADASVGTELPAELVAELREQGADAHGRLLTLAPGFIATAECSDCGAPSYLWFVAVRCADTRHCDVLTEVCEGQISRESSVYALEFRAVEGSGAAEAEVCAGYSGTFEGL